MRSPHKNPLLKNCAIACSVLFGSTALIPAAQVTISSITGWTASPNVINGAWTGQPYILSNSNFSNAYKGMLAIESQSSATKSTFTISGNNFGTTKGSVQFLDTSLNKLSGVTITIDSWLNSQVKVTVKCPYKFEYKKGGYVRISRDLNPPAMSYEGAAMKSVIGFVGVIQARGYGQCTWFVAKRRLDAGRSIPYPSAYSKTGSITGSYVPARYDGLLYGAKHVAIITSTPVKTTKSDGTVVYSFTVSEMNAYMDEKERSSTRTFEVKSGVITKKIGSYAGATYLATDYWR